MLHISVEMWHGGKKEMILSFHKERRSSPRPQSVKHLWDPSSLIKLWSNVSHLLERSCIFYKKGTYSSFLSWWFDVGRSCQGWWKWTQALIRWPDQHMCWPVSALQTLPFPSFSFSVISPSLPWFPPTVYYYTANRFHLPIKPTGRARWGTKDSESMSRKKEGRRNFCSTQHKHISLCSPRPSSEQTQMLQSHFSLFVHCIII